MRPPRCCRVVDALVAAWKPVARRQPASPSALQLADIGAAGTARRTARRSWNATCIAGFAQPAVYPAFRHLCSPLSSGPCSLPCSPPYFELGSQSNSEGKKGVSAAALFFCNIILEARTKLLFPGTKLPACTTSSVTGSSALTDEHTSRPWQLVRSHAQPFLHGLCARPFVRPSSIFENAVYRNIFRAL